MSTFVRLNLGCGDKILDGYINVDIVDERAGNKPDINCDVRQLTVFEDNSGDGKYRPSFRSGCACSSRAAK
jgi:predicted SAM-dependent methyltransferase